MSGVRTRLDAAGAYSPGVVSVLSYGHRERFDGTSRLVIALHGNAADATQYLQSSSAVGRTACALARTGRYIVLAVGAGGLTSWGNPASLSDVDAAVTWARASGARAGKYGLLAWSMGSLVAANKIKRDASSVAAAWSWAPVSDLSWAHAQGAWTSQIETAFGSYAASAGYRVADEPASFRSGVPWHLVHASDDASIPASQTTGFVAAVDDESVTAQVLPSGGHFDLFDEVPDGEIVAFYDAANW